MDWTMTDLPARLTGDDIEPVAEVDVHVMRNGKVVDVQALQHGYEPQ